MNKSPIEQSSYFGRPQLFYRRQLRNTNKNAERATGHLSFRKIIYLLEPPFVIMLTRSGSFVPNESPTLVDCSFLAFTAREAC